MTNSISPEPCGEVSGMIGVSGDILRLAQTPMASSKALDPPRHVSASPEGPRPTTVLAPST
jgi:hypothetical protein